MSVTFQRSGAVALKRIGDRRLPRLMEDRLGFKLMPIVNVNEWQLTYEKRNQIRGIQFARGMGGSPGQAKHRDFESRSVSAGVYADVYSFSEQNLTAERKLGSWQEFDPEGAKLEEASLVLTERYRDRIEKNVFDFLLTGGFEARNIQGVTYYQPVFEVGTSAPVTPFSTVATSTPIRFFRERIAALNQRGFSVSFSRGKGMAIMNRNTANVILANENANDLGGRRVDGGNTVNSWEGVDKILAANDIPDFTIYDQGIWPESGGFSLFIPDGRIILIGARDDKEPIGEYRQTRNANNPNSGPGEYYKVVDNRDKLSPPSIDCEHGHSGGPVPYHPEAIEVITAY